MTNGIYIYVVNQECATTKVRQLSSVTTFLVLLLATRWCQTDKFSTKEFAITTHFYNYVQTTPIHDVAGQIIFCSFLFLFFLKNISGCNFLGLYQQFLIYVFVLNSVGGWGQAKGEINPFCFCFISIYMNHFPQGPPSMCVYISGLQGNLPRCVEFPRGNT